MSDYKDTLYIDMDNVIADFKSGIRTLSESELEEFRDRYDEVPHIFSKMKPMEGAVDAFKHLSQYYDVYILSTAPWNNPSAWSDKLEWVKLYLGGEAGDPAYKRLILTHHKNLNRGDCLIDDRIDKNGSGSFSGELIHFGSEKYPDWRAVVKYLDEVFIYTS